jgi:hypothetical protein
MLTSILEWEAQDFEQANVGIQRGLDDFEAGKLSFVPSMNSPRNSVASITCHSIHELSCNAHPTLIVCSRSALKVVDGD